MTAVRNESDLEAVASIGVPGRADFEQFYSAYFHSLTIQLCAYTGDLSAAQDVVQEAFCRAFAHWKRIAGFDDPAGWVRHVAWNLATSRWRRTRTAMRFVWRQRAQHVPEPSPDRVALTRALATLPAKHRRVVILHYLGDLPVSEIAIHVGVPEGTVKSWLYRGRAALAAQLTEEEEKNRE